MKTFHLYKKIFLSAFLLLTAIASAQQSFVATGGNASGTGGTVSYSVGQISYKSPDGNLVSDGVQQPYEIVTLGKGTTDIILAMAVYPNPTPDFLQLNLKQQVLENPTYQLFDMSGRILTKPTAIVNQETVIPMTQWTSGTYIFSVFSKNKLVKSFKIIKK